MTPPLTDTSATDSRGLPAVPGSVLPCPICRDPGCLGNECEPPYEDYTDSEEYQRFVGGLADKCRCEGPVCAGLLAGGFCDEIV